MIKNIFLILSFFTAFFAQMLSVSARESVETIFSDIDKNYEYYDELQALYDRGMIQAESGSFEPDSYLTREEFIGIVSEVSCKKCIKPDVGPGYFQKYYNSEPFFDVTHESPYFYCIAGAADEGSIRGYDVGTSCEDGTKQAGAAPFCPKNTIVLEEALAIILRSSGILTNAEAELVRQKIRAGEDFPALARDVQALNNGYVYSFYPDFRKALDYKITEYDTSGKKKVYYLLEKDGEYLYPERAVTKEQFIRMAYVALKGNSCIEVGDELDVNIKIFDKNCSEAQVASCEDADLQNDDTFDFFAETSGENLNYLWRIYDYSDGTEVVKEGRYINDYQFEKGKYRVYLTVSDGEKSSEVYNDLTIGIGVAPNVGFLDNLKTSIAVDPQIGQAPLPVSVEGKVSGNAIKNYSWDFGDGTQALGINAEHIYKEAGNYEIIFRVENSRGAVSEAKTVVVVQNDSVDSDGDGVPDSEDYEIHTPADKILFICTKADIENNLYNCQPTDLGVYSPEKEQALSGADTDGDGVRDYIDEEKETPADLVDSICTETDIELGRDVCAEGDLGVGNPDSGDAMDMALEMIIYDKSCRPSDTNCERARLGDGASYDFTLDSNLTGFEAENASYNWQFIHRETGEVIEKNGVYIDNQDFIREGVYDIILTVTSPYGNTASVKNTLYIGNSDSNLSLSIRANPIYTAPNNPINFEAIYDGEKNVAWDFGDTNYGSGTRVEKSYVYEGVYEVTAEISDENGNTEQATVSVYISERVEDSDGDGVADNDDREVQTPADQIDYICTENDVQTSSFGCSTEDLGVYNPEKFNGRDTDGDGVADRSDACPLMAGDLKNRGCPIFEQVCETNEDCPEGYYCDGNYCRLQILARSCDYRGESIVLGNVACNSCPCEYDIDFRASVRNCDVLFPAITSRDEKNIFSKGNYYQVREDE